MDSYLCEDSEELFQRFGVVKKSPFSLSGIIGIAELAEAGLIEDTLESIRYGGDIDAGMEGACRGGHKELVLMMIEKGTKNHIQGLIGACSNGHKELALMIIRKCKVDRTGLYWALGAACFNGQKEIALYLAQRIGHSDNPISINHFDFALTAACLNGHKEVARMMIEEGATSCGCDKPIDEH
jgi:hypothetical protein